MKHARILGTLAVALAVSGGWLIRAQDETAAGEWRSSGGDSSYKRYSPLAQITRDNVKSLRIVWHRPALDPKVKEQFPKLRTNNNLVKGKQYIVVPVGGRDEPAEWVALALP